MPKIKYEEWKPDAVSARMIREADKICRAYAAQGYDLTLRQVYYEFVAHDLFPDERRWNWVNTRWVRADDGTKNAEPNYKWLAGIINKGRLAGFLDWDHIVDRTRALRGTSHWDNPGDVVDAAARSFRLDKWATQRRRVELWVEKDALGSVVQRVADRYDVSWFSCRGYVSQSEQWAAARRLLDYLLFGQAVTILHLGDHDPSGVDMTRDIRDRLETFITQDWVNEHMPGGPGSVSVREIMDSIRERVNSDEPLEIRRIALNMDQIRRYDPPPNPAKLTDSRARGYISEHGNESWELDALTPDVLAALIGEHIEEIRDLEAYQDLEGPEAGHRELLRLGATRWPSVVGFLRAGG